MCICLELSFPFWTWSGTPVIHMVWQAGGSADTPSEPRTQRLYSLSLSSLEQKEKRGDDAMADSAHRARLAVQPPWSVCSARKEEAQLATGTHHMHSGLMPGNSMSRLSKWETPTHKQRQGLMSKETTHDTSPKYFFGENWHSLFGIDNKTWIQSPAFLSALTICGFWQDVSFFEPHFLYILNKRAKNSFFLFIFFPILNILWLHELRQMVILKMAHLSNHYPLNKTKKILFWPVSNSFCWYSRSANHMISIGIFFYLIHSVLFISPLYYSLLCSVIV